MAKRVYTVANKAVLPEHRQHHVPCQIEAGGSCLGPVL